MRALWISIAASMVLGCATNATVRDAPQGAGFERSFARDRVAVYRATELALADSGYEVVERFPRGSAWVLVAERGVRWQSWGDEARVTVEPAASGRTVVRIVQEPRLATNVLASEDFTTDATGDGPELYERIAARLAR